MITDRPASAWTEFWFAERSAASLGLFRILFAACLAAEVATSRVKNVNAIDDGTFHLDGLAWFPPVSAEAYGILHLVQYPLIVLLGAGVLFRGAALALALAQGWLLLADPLNFRNHPYFFLLVLLLLAPSAAGRALSLPGLIRSLDGDRSALIGSERPVTFQRLIQVQVCLVYGFAGLHKLHPAYLSGSVLEDLLQRRWPAAAQWPAAVPLVLAWLSVLIELSLAGMLWSRRWRPIAIGAGTLFHLTIAWALDIRTFSFAMISAYVLFCDPTRIERWTLRPARRPAPRRERGHA